MVEARSTCTACGTALVDGARFCHSCGTAVVDATVPTSVEVATPEPRSDLRFVLWLALAAAAAIKVSALFGADLYEETGGSTFHFRNLSLFVLPFVAWFLVRTRQPQTQISRLLPLPFLAGALVANIWHLGDPANTEVVLALHLPVALLLIVGVAHAGDGWRTVEGRLAFIRFTGEWMVHYVLLGLGGLALVGLTAGGFEVLGISADLEYPLTGWILPCGAMGAVVIAAWMADRRLETGDGIAPVLARAFTPLFAVAVFVLLVGSLTAGDFLDMDRDALVLLDVLLLVVLGLLLYTVSARDPQAPPTWLDRIQIALLVAAVVLDVIALISTLGRIGEWGLTANRTAALGINLILLAQLGGSAWLAIAALRGRRPFPDLLRWQSRFLPVFAAWATVVMVAFPPIFDLV